MAKDDYDVIVFKILTYLYACLKRKIIFDKEVFDHTIKRKNINEQYFADILYMMKEEELIDNIVIVKTWGKDKIIISDISDIEITAEGIHYLKDNSKMKEVKEFLISKMDIIASLAQMVI